MPVPTSVTKEIDHLTDLHRAYIEASPFVVVATSGPGGVDCSPRGDPPGFVRVADERTLLMPDRRGNNRLDTLRNIVVDPRIGLLFLVPGVGVTLRVNGTAQLSTDIGLRRSFAVDGKLPATVVVVTTTSVYTQCPKALIRSHLWDRQPPSRRVRTAVGRRDHGGDHRRRVRRQGLRRRLSRADPPDHLLSRVRRSTRGGSHGANLVCRRWNRRDLRGDDAGQRRPRRDGARTRSHAATATRHRVGRVGPTRCQPVPMLHFFLARFREVADAELPGLTDAMVAAGALRMNLLIGIPDEITGGWRDGDERFETVTARRPVGESVIAGHRRCDVRASRSAAASASPGC